MRSVTTLVIPALARGDPALARSPRGDEAASAALASMPWGECLVPPTNPPAAMSAEVRRATGAVPGWLARVAPCPWLVRAITRSSTRPWAYAPPALWDLIELVVSQDNSCRYCFGVQRAVLRVAGYDDARLARLERDFHRADLGSGERAALEFARKLSRANPRPRRSDREALERSGFGRLAVAEIAFTGAAAAFLNRVATLLALPIERDLESFVERSSFRLLRPLVAWRKRPRSHAPLPPPPNAGVGAAVVAALGDSPSATLLRRTIDEAWSSGLLPRRTKALLLAVIAKALGCAHGERDARAALAAEGVDGASVDQVLANLWSPGLDRREAALVPFARETVRYRPAEIQRRMVEVTRDMTAGERVELAGILGLANALCRLSVLLADS